MVSYSIQWGGKFPLTFQNRLEIGLEIHLLNKNHKQDKNQNVVGVVNYTDARSKQFREKFVVF